MKASSPAFQFYPKDYMTDANVMEMTHEQRGIYVDLLAIYWLEDGLPSDLGRLARLVGLPPKRFERLWPAIGRCFKVEGAALRQKRLEEEKLKQATYKDEQRRKGSRGGKAKAINKTRKPRPQSGYVSAVAEGKPKASFPVSVSVSVPIPFPSTDNGTDSGGNEPPPFPSKTVADAYLRHYPKAEVPKPMFKELRPLVAKHGWLTVEPELDAYLEATEAQFHNWPKFASGFGSWARGRASPRAGPRTAAAVTVNAIQQILNEEAEKADGRQGDVHGGLGGDGPAVEQAGGTGTPRRLPPGLG